mmetsp:Transcript_14070/g.25421  ORF Transcript_14070/g.25421 Transcript_14070/m.25421 type:complete len:314 (+) Transcript_14070:55-996(+)|eukprot:CAMPEP_0197519674 /NCGR_PEP_ID=MMETSP1318-20131121/4945_1 /TAXON_ID=552666 /ORGANISM="Partenskyella glossopodia, Strain RCC365" /LENGTH=313 /DNA_ID=CAMNT_0043070801 /DNA_START=42 /DNA_END=983 /DNA_ORIENTATION=+
MSYHHEQISRYTWKIVENDPYGQYPFLYAIMGVDKCVIIDTGTGAGNFAKYVDEHINHERRLPYLVINTHVHFDHVGGNSRFQARKGFKGIHMGGANKIFSQNVDINSLCLAHNCAVQHYKVDKWLKQGDRIYLDDSKESSATCLEIIETPGHTPDSIAIYSHIEKLLFVGDNIYPYTVIHLDCIGSNVDEYLRTLQKLESFVTKVSDNKAGKLCFKDKKSELICLPCDDDGSAVQRKSNEISKDSKEPVGKQNITMNDTADKKNQRDKELDEVHGIGIGASDGKSSTSKDRNKDNPHQILINKFLELVHHSS